MCTLLIVEDEAPFRDGIVSMIDWAAHGIRICGAAGNGQEAWALIEQETPDLVLTDIRMPVMDGIELLARVKQAGLPTQVILLSGFSEFEYAKQAMKLGAVDYLLKPCKPEEILAVVTEAFRSLENHAESRRLAKEQLLSQWMQPGSAASAAMLSEYRVAFVDAPLHVGVVRGAAPGLRVALSPFYGGRLEVFPVGADLVWVGNVAPGALDRDALRLALQGTVCGVGGVRGGIAGLHESYAEARQALGLREDLPLQSVFFFDDAHRAGLNTEGALTDPTIAAREAEILQHMQAGRYAQAIDATGHWLEHLRSHTEYSLRQIRLRAVSLLLGVQRTAQVQSIPAIRWKEELIEGINLLPTVESLDDLSTIITKFLQHLVGVLSSHRPLHRTVEAAVRIVEAHYSSNLTLEAVAREVFVSTSYLSTLFKQEMGINFLDYLHQYRVERAKELLGREALKVFAVARLVGYQDERHFSATFKKWTGVSPSQFQAACRSGHGVV
ncbi:MAG TPA: response regulator [Symbiobacteriaceae bacterium]|nr:response regulator [Symbiobacteriaceae bacterium]